MSASRHKIICIHGWCNNCALTYLNSPLDWSKDSHRGIYTYMSLYKVLQHHYNRFHILNVKKSTATSVDRNTSQCHEIITVWQTSTELIKNTSSFSLLSDGHKQLYISNSSPCLQTFPGQSGTKMTIDENKKGSGIRQHIMCAHIK